jgi:hypothetical protein
MEQKGFFGSLFDFSFETFVFPRVISVIYGIVVVVIALAYLFFVVGAFSRGAAAGVGALVLGPIVAVLYLIMVRAWMEVAIVMFRIHDDVRTMRDMKKGT